MVSINNLNYYFRSGLDPCLIYATLHSVLDQVAARGDANVPHYARHISTHNDVALSDVNGYVYLHEVLAEGAECGMLHSVLHASATMYSNGSLSEPMMM